MQSKNKVGFFSLVAVEVRALSTPQNGPVETVEFVCID